MLVSGPLQVAGVSLSTILFADKRRCEPWHWLNHAETPLGWLVDLCDSTLHHSVEFLFHAFKERDGHSPWQGEQLSILTEFNLVIVIYLPKVLKQRCLEG